MKYSLIKRFSFALLILALLISVPTLSYGQWILGIKAGYVSTKLTGADVYVLNSQPKANGMNWKPGFEAGMVISKKLKVDFAFESGIFYSQAGVNQKYIHINKVYYQDPSTGVRVSDDSTYRYDNSLSLNYIKIPLMLRKSFSIRGSNLYPYRRKISITDIDIMVGPYVSYLLSASAAFSTKVSVIHTEDDKIIPGLSKSETGLNDPQYLSFNIGRDTINQVITTDPSIPGGSSLNPYLPKRADLNKGLSKFDVGIVAAVGLSIELSPDSKLMFGGNYSMGLLTIDKEYFSNLQYTVSLGGTTDIGTGTPVSISKKVSRKMDLKNTGMGFYLAYVKYLK